MKLESITRNKDGNFYIIYSYPSIQQIRRTEKQKGKRELMIYGINKNKLKDVWFDLLEGVDEI